MARLPWLILFPAAVSLLTAPAHAKAPRIKFRVEQATCLEAVLALQRAADVLIELRTPADTADGVPAPAATSLLERHTFDFSNVTLSQALREVAARYRLRAESSRGGVALVPDELGSPPLRFAETSAAQTNGVRAFVQKTILSGEVGTAANSYTLSIVLRGRVEDAPNTLLYSIENLEATDDRGSQLRNGPARSPGNVAYDFPDEWSAIAQLRGVPEGAKRLLSLKADLVGYPVTRLGKAEAALPLPQNGAFRDVGEGRIEFVALEPARYALIAGPRDLAGPSLVVRFHGFGTSVLTPGNGFRGIPGPVLIGASGRAYAPPGAAGSVMEDTRGYGEVTYTFPFIEEPVVGVRFDLATSGIATRLGTLQFRDVPLPAPADTPGLTSFGAFRPSPLRSGSRYFAEDGGTVHSPISQSAEDLREGTLYVGLSSVDGTGKTEWYAAEVRAGRAQLMHVAPGAYRVLRLYRASAPPGKRSTGWWRGGELVAQVRAGEETTLPPLELVRDPAPAEKSRIVGPRFEGTSAEIKQVVSSFSVSREDTVPVQVEKRSALRLTVAGSSTGTLPLLMGGLANVVARDDRGNLLSAQGVGGFAPAHRGGAVNWEQAVLLNTPHREATRLEWLEGDLMAHGEPYPLQIHIPATLPEGGISRHLDELRLEINELTSAPAPAGRNMPGTREYLLRGRITAPEGTLLQGLAIASPEAELIGESGRAYSPVSTGHSFGFGAWNCRASYAVSEPVKSIRISLRVWPALRSIGSFRITNIPLTGRNAPAAAARR
jgi:hypothetical protein